MATANTDALRVIQIPNGDYTSATFRAELQTQLNAAAFQGRIPEGSGTQYAVSGTDNEIRVGTSEMLVFGQDTFVILGEPFLKEIQHTRFFTTAWDANQPRSANAICGNMGAQNLQKMYGAEDIDFRGFWSAPAALPTPTHLDGTWTYGQVPLTVTGDAVPGDYEARTAEGVHVRYFSRASPKRRHF